MKLNKCQTKQLTNLTNWFLGTEQFAILHGKAGTGKTFLMKAFLSQFPKIKCFIGAETNEAVEVIAKATDYTYLYGTVCNLLCLRLAFEKHEKKLKQFAEPKLEEIELIIIDEGSMLDEFKLKLLMGLGKKILFVGHKSQLPPIIKDLSLLDKCLPPLFEQNFPIYELITVERNKGELLSFCNQAEKAIYENIPWKGDFIQTRAETFEKFFNTKEGLQSILDLRTSILSYTNAATDTYNVLFRKKYFGEKIADKEEFLPKDKIILRTPTASFVKDVSKQNGVTSVLKPKHVSEILATNTKAEVLESRNVEILGISAYLLKIKSIGARRKFLAYTYVPQDLQEYEKFKHSYFISALYEREPLLAEKKWSLYHDIEKIFGNTKHAYARTIHTAQGSTLDTVIVDEGDIDKCQNIFLRKKLRYVAYSRAKNTLIRLI